MDEEFKMFLSKLETKMQAGKEKHNGFLPTALGTIDEIEMELLDICGWGFLLWQRLIRLKKALKSQLDESVCRSRVDQ